MSIQITIQAETGSEARQKLADLLGIQANVRDGIEIYDESGAGSGAASAEADVQNNDRHDTTPDGQQVIEGFHPTEQPKRKRRTKAEIEAARAPAPQISTGEERVAPDDPPEVQAQDEADEMAESAARKAENPVLTRDDLREAMGGYVNAYGMAAAQGDGTKIFEAALGRPGPLEGMDDPNGGRRWSLSTVPEEKFAAAIAAWKEATVKNPFGRGPARAET